MKRAFPAILFYVGIPAVAILWCLALRLVWEQTVWTWERGAQMVGFSLMHSGLGGILVLGVAASLAWPAAALIAAAITRSLGGRRVILLLCTYGLGWALLTMPYGFWQRLFIAKFTPAQAVELMTYAAAEGDLRTVKAFLGRGVDVNTQGRNGTALHAAAVQAQLEIMEFLLSKGADANAISAYGDSPMINAAQAEQRSAEAQALLAKHGGKSIRASKEHRDRVVQEQVRQDMERMQAEMPK